LRQKFPNFRESGNLDFWASAHKPSLVAVYTNTGQLQAVGSRHKTLNLSLIVLTYQLYTWQFNILSLVKHETV